MWLSQLMASSLYAMSTPNGSITLHNHPFPSTLRQQAIFTGLISFFAAIGVVIGYAFISAFHASFLVAERESNVKFMQLIAGISIPAYWVSSLLWDIIVYQIPCCT